MFFFNVEKIFSWYFAYVKTRINLTSGIHENKHCSILLYIKQEQIKSRGFVILTPFRDSTPWPPKRSQKVYQKMYFLVHLSSKIAQKWQPGSFKVAKTGPEPTQSTYYSYRRESYKRPPPTQEPPTARGDTEPPPVTAYDMTGASHVSMAKTNFDLSLIFKKLAF